VSDLAPLDGLGLGHLSVRSPVLSSLAGLTSLPAIRVLGLGSALTELDPFTIAGPAWLDLTGNPLDGNALAVIPRLCGAGWAVDWDGGSCGTSCNFESCTN
jgi:hypothetical protein